MKLSDVAKSIPVSPLRGLAPLAHEAEKKGTKVYHLNIGNPDIETPAVMINSLKKWTDKTIGYSDSHGDKHFLKSLLWYYRTLGFDKLHYSNLQVTFGGSEALLWVFTTICNPGDEIITFEPFYTNYSSFVVISHAKIVPIKTVIDSGFHLPESAQIEEKITPKTRAILLCNPSNPTGTVYTKEELDMIVNIAKKNHLYIISDEVYREFVYDKKKSISMLEYADQYRDGIIIVDSLSKRYSLCGARLGVIVSFNHELMSIFLRFAQARLSAGYIDQSVATELVNVEDDYFAKVIEEYRLRRNLVVSELNKIEGVFCPNPEGAFYVIVRLPIEDSEQFAQWLLTDFSDNSETIMLAPATGFYSSKNLGHNEVRIAYVINRKDLGRSIELLKKALIIYKSL